MKKLLFIALPYHDYTSEIIDELKKQGFLVSFYPIKPRSFFHKVLQTVLPSVFQRYLDKYHAQIVEKERGIEYDTVFFLQAHFFGHKNFSALKTTQSKARFILYNWDSIKTHDYSGYIKYFDKVATFDREDAKVFDLAYLPLFCTRQFKSMQKHLPTENRIYFVGNIVNPNRYQAVQAFKSYCKANQIIFEAYLKCTLVTFVHLLLKGYLPIDISFKNISKKAFSDLVVSSTTVFDYANHSQSGYTMRFMENLCIGKRIITNNTSVLNETFYSEERFFLFKDLQFDGIDVFMNCDFNAKDEEFEEFHLESFINSILDNA